MSTLGVIRGLALATRSDADTTYLNAFLKHHLQVCEKAFVLIDHRDHETTDDVFELLKSFGDRVIGVPHKHAVFANGRTCTALSRVVAAHQEFDVVMHVDKDEFFSNLHDVAAVVARIRSGRSDYAQGVMICRLAPGCNLYPSHFDSFEEFCRAAPVRADIIKAYQFPNVKCCINRAPTILIHSGRNGWKQDMTQFDLEHFRWIDRIQEKTLAKVSQHPPELAGRIKWRDRMVREKTSHFQEKAEKHFHPAAWQIHGWMDYGDLFRDIARAIPDGGTFVELGVWQGRSVSYICEYATFLGKRLRAYGYDIFDPGYCPKASRLGMTSDECLSEVRERLRRNCPWNTPEVVRCRSAEAAAFHADGSVDALWVDAGHDEKSVFDDLTAWVPKLKNSGAILAGHDIQMPSVRAGLSKYGIQYERVSKSSWKGIL